MGTLHGISFKLYDIHWFTNVFFSYYHYYFAFSFHALHFAAKVGPWCVVY